MAGVKECARCRVAGSSIAMRWEMVIIVVAIVFECVMLSLMIIPWSSHCPILSLAVVGVYFTFVG